MESCATVTYAWNPADLLDSEDESFTSYTLPTHQQTPPLPPLQLKRLGSCPARPVNDNSQGPQSVREVLPPRRQCSLMSSLASIDELEPLELDCPSPVVAASPGLSAYQVADLMRSIARSCPGSALTPLPAISTKNTNCSSGSRKGGARRSGPSTGAPSCPLPPFVHPTGSLGGTACAAYPLPPGPPPIATRVGQKKPAAADSGTELKMPKLKIRTPRRHFGTEACVAAAALLQEEQHKVSTTSAQL